MKISRRLSAQLLLIVTIPAALVASLAAAATALPRPGGSAISNISPPEGAFGTAVDFNGGGFTGKPKIVLRGMVGNKSKDFPFKLKSVDSNLITSTTPKAPAGVYDVIYTLKPVNQTLAGAFTVKPPEISDFAPTQILPGETLAIHGEFFGTAKGKISLGNTKVTKIFSWNDGDINIQIPTKTLPGLYNINLTNTAASISSAGQVLVNPALPSANGPDFVQALIDHTQLIQCNSKNITVGYDFANFRGNIHAENSTNTDQRLILILPFNLNTDTAPKTVSNIAGGGVTYTDLSLGTSWSSSEIGGSYTYQVATENGSTSKGSHMTWTGEADLVRSQGSGGNATIHITFGTRAFF